MSKTNVLVFGLLLKTSDLQTWPTVKKLALFVLRLLLQTNHLRTRTIIKANPHQTHEPGADMAIYAVLATEGRPLNKLSHHRHR